MVVLLSGNVSRNLQCLLSHWSFDRSCPQGATFNIDHSCFDVFCCIWSCHYNAIDWVDAPVCAQLSVDVIRSCVKELVTFVCVFLAQHDLLVLEVTSLALCAANVTTCDSISDALWFTAHLPFAADVSAHQGIDFIQDIESRVNEEQVGLTHCRLLSHWIRGPSRPNGSGLHALLA